MGTTVVIEIVVHNGHQVPLFMIVAQLTGSAHQPKEPTMSTTIAPTITPRMIEDFALNGVLIVPGLFTEDEVATIKQGIDANLADPSPRFKVASTPQDPGKFVEDFCNWQRIPQFREIAFTSRSAGDANRLLRVIPHVHVAPRLRRS